VTVLEMNFDSLENHTAEIRTNIPKNLSRVASNSRVTSGLQTRLYVFLDGGNLLLVLYSTFRALSATNFRAQLIISYDLFVP